MSSELIVVSADRREIPHVQVPTTALGVRVKPAGRPLPAPSVTLDGLADYVQRASKIRYAPSPAHLLYEKLKIILAEKNILIYDDNAVDAWMASMVKKERKNGVSRWVWKSLTEPLSDLAKRVTALDRIRYQHQRRVGKELYGTIDRYQRYTKIIPSAVLATAEAILGSFDLAKDPICLLVTDYEVLQPDPFLAVAVPDFPFLVVDFWDEPGFQPKAADLPTQQMLNS